MRCTLMICVLLTATALHTHAEGDLSLFRAAKTLKISIQDGFHTKWDKEGGRKTEQTTWSLDLTINDIDLSNGTAKLIGNAGTSDLSVIDTITSLSFVEEIVPGSITLLSVLGTRPKGAPGFVVVFSRHILLSAPLGGKAPALSQYYGYAEVISPEH